MSADEFIASFAKQQAETIAKQGKKLTFLQGLGKRNGLISKLEFIKDEIAGAFKRTLRKSKQVTKSVGFDDVLKKKRLSDTFDYVNPSARAELK